MAGIMMMMLNTIFILTSTGCFSLDIYISKKKGK